MLESILLLSMALFPLIFSNGIPRISKPHNNIAQKVLFYSFDILSRVYTILICLTIILWTIFTIFSEYYGYSGFSELSIFLADYVFQMTATEIQNVALDISIWTLIGSVLFLILHIIVARYCSQFVGSKKD